MTFALSDSDSDSVCFKICLTDSKVLNKLTTHQRIFRNRTIRMNFSHKFIRIFPVCKGIAAIAVSCVVQLEWSHALRHCCSYMQLRQRSTASKSYQSCDQSHYKHIKSRFCGKYYFDLAIGRHTQHTHAHKLGHLFGNMRISHYLCGIYTWFIYNMYASYVHCMWIRVTVCLRSLLIHRNAAIITILLSAYVCVAKCSFISFSFHSHSYSFLRTSYV